jgi:hypothetical protein
VRLGQRAAEHGEVLAEHVDEPAVDRAIAGHHAIAQELLLFEPEARGPVRDEPVQLDEAAVIEQQIEPLARGQLAALMLRFEPLPAAAQLGLLPELLELLQLLSHGHGRIGRRSGPLAGSGARSKVPVSTRSLVNAEAGRARARRARTGAGKAGE